jgi:hypothetical protein
MVQTLLRVRSRFVHHYSDIFKADATKFMGTHFSQGGHNCFYDLEISVLEFIKKLLKVL